MNNMFKAILLANILLLQGCFLYGEKKALSLTSVIKSKEDSILNSSLTSVDVSNNQVTIRGKGFSKVTSVKLKNNGVDAVLNVDSKSDSQIIATATSALSLLVGTTFDLIIGTADAQSTYAVTFTLQNGAISAAHLSSMGATPGQVMKYNGHAWVATSFSNAQVYQGTWDASANSPDLSSPSNIAGDYYIVSVAGTLNAISYDIGDWIISDGSNWQKVANSSFVVSSFNGRRGLVTLVPGDYVSLKDGTTHKITGSSLNDLADLDLSTVAAVSGDVLKFNGSKWVPGTVSGGGGGSVTSVSGTLPISVATGTSTPVVSISQASTSTNGYLSSTDWNIFNNKEEAITAGANTTYLRGDKTFVTLDTGAVPENGNLYFNNARVLGVALTGFSATNSAVVSTDTVLAAMGKVQGQIDSLSSGGANYLVKNGTDAVTGEVTIDATTGSLKIPTTPSGVDLTDAVNVQYVKTYADTKLPLIGGTMTGDLQLNTKVKLKDSGTNTVSVTAPTTVTASYVLTLPPAKASVAGQVLTSDTSGVLSWTTPSAGAVTSVNSQTGVVTLTTDNVTEGSSNFYFTNGRTIASTLTSFAVGANGTIASTDTVLGAFGKTQGQINATNTAVAGKEPSITAGTTAQYWRGDKSWSTLASDVLAVTLSGLSTATNAVVTSSDSILVAIGKLQAEISANSTSISSKADLTNGAQTITALAVTGLTTPSVAADAANKGYVDSVWVPASGSITRNSGNVFLGAQATRSTASTNRGQLTATSTYQQVTNVSAAVDWNNGNQQEINTFLCDGTKTITFSNAHDGAAYSLLLTGTAAHSGKCLFVSSGMTFKISGGSVAPTASKDVLFTFAVIGTTIVYNMLDNLQ